MFKAISDASFEFDRKFMAEWWDNIPIDDDLFDVPIDEQVEDQVVYPTLIQAVNTVSDIVTAYKESSYNVKSEIVVRLVTVSPESSLVVLRLEESDRFKPNEVIERLIDNKIPVTFSHLSMDGPRPLYHDNKALIVQKNGDTIFASTNGVFRRNSRYVLKYQMEMVSDLTKDRVAISLVALQASVGSSTSLVRGLLKYDHGSKLPCPHDGPSKLMKHLGFESNLAYLWGQPGVGKTRFIGEL